MWFPSCRHNKAGGLNPLLICLSDWRGCPLGIPRSHYMSRNHACPTSGSRPDTPLCRRRCAGEILPAREQILVKSHPRRRRAGSSIGRSGRPTRDEARPPPHHIPPAPAQPASAASCGDPMLHGLRCCRSTSPAPPPWPFSAGHSRVEHWPCLDFRRIQSNCDRPNRSGVQIGGRPLPFLAALAARDAEQPRIRIDRLDNMLDLDRHQLRGAQPGVIARGE